LKKRNEDKRPLKKEKEKRLRWVLTPKLRELKTNLLLTRLPTLKRIRKDLDKSCFKERRNKETFRRSHQLVDALSSDKY